MGQPAYQAHWALTSTDEERAFSEVVGLIMDTWASHPAMHVYHYAPYEPAALKRLMVGSVSEKRTSIAFFVVGASLIYMRLFGRVCAQE
jgi:uncharacterized protein